MLLYKIPKHRSWNMLKKNLPLIILLFSPLFSFAGEADLVIPDVTSVQFLGTDGRTLLLWGMLVCVFGLLFGFVQFIRIKNMPVHKSMKEISELIYETCKTYLITQGKFILVLEILVGLVMVAYFGWLRHFEASKVVVILICC